MANAPHHPSGSTHTSGPEDPHAFDNIALAARPSFGDYSCPVCHGHGEWNEELFAGGRAIVKACPTCAGFGWLHDREHVQLDIAMVNGAAHWVMIIDKDEPKPRVPPVGA